LTMTAGNAYTHKVEFVIPGGTNPGYYRGAIGIFESNWKNLAWHDTVVMVGVGENNIVGAKSTKTSEMLVN